MERMEWNYYGAYRNSGTAWSDSMVQNEMDALDGDHLRDEYKLLFFVELWMCTVRVRAIKSHKIEGKGRDDREVITNEQTKNRER